jgi:hypothetical protein
MTPTNNDKILSKTIDYNKVVQVYGDLFYALRAIVNEYNPMCFGHLDDFPDEYDPEVATIIAQLKHQMTIDEVHNVVFNEFQYWFAPIHISKADYFELSNAIFLWLQDVTLPEVELASLFRI